MTLEQINALTLENSFYTILYKLVDFSGFNEKAYNISEDTSLSMYDRLSLHVSLVKPTLLEFEAEFALYKQGLIDEYNARLVEEARVLDIKTKYSSIESFIHTLKVGTSYENEPNPASILSDILTFDNQVDLDSMLAKLPGVIALEEGRKLRKIKKEVGRKQKLACEECLSLIRGYNEGKTDTEIDSMLTTFASIYSALIQHRPTKARTLIESVPNDGIIDLLKQDLLEELSEHNF